MKLFEVQFECIIEKEISEYLDKNTKNKMLVILLGNCDWYEYSPSYINKDGHTTSVHYQDYMKSMWTPSKIADHLKDTFKYVDKDNLPDCVTIVGGTPEELEALFEFLRKYYGVHSILFIDGYTYENTPELDQTEKAYNKQQAKFMLDMYKVGTVDLEEPYLKKLESILNS